MQSNNIYCSKNQKPKTSNYLGFTLVELIVVITILVILGTIAFTSLSGYSSSARDSSRVSDFDNLKKSLQLTYIKTGSFPTPTNGTGVTFSGGIVWTQGSIGDSVINILNAAGFKFSRKPTDPKYPNIEYTYSLLNTGKEYQLGMIVEDGTTTYNTPNSTESFISQTYAAENIIAYLGGNYNGLVAKVQTGTTTYYLTLPSITLSNISNGTELTVSTAQSGNLVLHKKGNLPQTYMSNAVASTTPSITFSALINSDKLTSGSGIVAYSTTGSLTAAGVSVLMNNLYTIYNTSTLKTDATSASQVVSLMVAGTGNTALTDFYNVSISKNIGGPTVLWTTIGWWDCVGVDNLIGSNGNTSTCTDNRTYAMQDGATHDKMYNLLKIGWKWWFNENLAYPLPDVSKYRWDNSWSETDIWLYSCPGSTNWQTTVDCSLVPTSGYLYQWSAAMNGTISNSGTTGRTQGICPSGWGIPTKADFSSASNAYWPDPASTSDNTWTGNTVWWTIPFIGWRLNDAGGTIYFGNIFACVWSSFEDSPTHAWFEYFNYYGPVTQSFRSNNFKANGFSVRCIKN